MNTNDYSYLDHAERVARIVQYIKEPQIPIFARSPDHRRKARKR